MSQKNTLTNPLPRFSDIDYAKTGPELTNILSQNRASLDKIVKDTPYSWEKTIDPLEALEDNLNRFWSPISHLNSVLNSNELRSVYETCIPLLSDYYAELGQNEALYKAFENIQSSDEFKEFTQARKQLINLAVRDFALAGVALKGDDKETFRQLKAKLSELCNQFNNNVLDATQSWYFHTEDMNDLSGLPESALSMGKAAAKEKKELGYVFTLDFPSYHAIMTYADRSELRKKFYEAYVTRASELGPDKGKYDNSKIIEEILACRLQLAQLLGFDSYAEYSIATKMAESTEAVLQFLYQLNECSHDKAKSEYEELTRFAPALGHKEIAAWDLAYFSEKLRVEKYDVSQESLRPYFPIAKVLDGLFTIIQKLYGMIVQEKISIDVWHKDVRFFEIHDSTGKLRGQFYLDLYARTNKRGGAWMDECTIRYRRANGLLQVPTAYIVCNFSGPTQGKPALLTHDEVTTLFHEVGHGLHHVLTEIDYPSVAGINGVPWDAVELPSQFFENWCWQPVALELISGHYKTGKPLPKSMVDKLNQAKNFQSAMQMARQLEFAIFDFKLHSCKDAVTQEDIQALLDEVRKEVSVVKPPTWNRFQNSFSHIFGGGYAAGYYSYKWAEVLASDAFSLFEENGIFDRDTGLAFLRCVLEQGGSQDPLTLFRSFRGRAPSIEALLRHSGIDLRR